MAQMHDPVKREPSNMEGKRKVSGDPARTGRVRRQRVDPPVVIASPNDGSPDGLAAMPAHLPSELIHRLVAFVGVLTPDGVLIEANAPALAGAGLTLEDVVGRPFWECSWWNHDAYEQERLRSAVTRAARGETVRYDAVVRMAGDTRMTIDFMLAPLRDERGRVTHLVPSATNITDRIVAQTQASERLNLLETLYATTPVALCTFDADLRYERVNHALCEMVGLSAEAMIGKTLRDVMPGVIDSAEPLLRRVLATGEPVQKQIVEGHTPGDPASLRKWEVSYSPLRDATDRVSGVSCVGVEITQTERDRAAVIEARERADRKRGEIESIYRNAPVGLCVLDRELRWLRANERLAEINGFPVEAHWGRSVAELLPEIAEVVRGYVHHVLDTGETVQDIEVVGETPAQPGVRRVWRVDYSPILDGSGKPVAVNVITKEITQDKIAARKLEEALRTAERRKAELESILAVSPAGLAYHDADLTIRYMNPQLERINGIPNAQLVGTRPGATDNLLAAQVVPLLRRVVELGEPLANQQITWSPPYDAETPHHYLVNYEPVWRGEAAEREVMGVMASVIDISEMVESRRRLESWTHRLEAEVAQRTREVVEQNRRLHRLGEEVMNAQNRERRRVARILHDDLQQVIAAARIDADVLAMRENDPDSVAHSLRNLLIEACNTARNLSHELYPAVLSTHGLGEALRWLAREFQERYRLQIACEIEPQHAMSVQAQAFLYDVARELLFNVHKHAGVDHARLSLTVAERVARLAVADEGKGCDEPTLMGHPGAGKNSMGLPLIRHRLELLRGSMRVVADPDCSDRRGCHIVVELPVQAGDVDASAAEAPIPE